MSVSRWKVMAGVLGISMGGLAAIAGQCPKPGEHKTQRADDRAEAPNVLPPAGSGRVTVPSPPELPSLPAPANVDQVKLPNVPPPSSAPPVPLPNPTMPAPYIAPVLPVAGTAPANPPVTAPTSPTPIEFTKPPMTPPAVVTGPVVPPVAVQPNPAPVTPPVAVQPATPQPTTPPIVVQPTTPIVSEAPPIRQQQAVASTTKFRIILRVGEGEPTFEVRSGDDLVMKVVCEKVDIKSPERGQSLSAVTASGRVRFVGFGSEGTCDSLSFLAGTGEVSMSGNVKIQVKDKLGRVESELTTESIKYRIDTSILPGTLKP